MHHKTFRQKQNVLNGESYLTKIHLRVSNVAAYSLLNLSFNLCLDVYAFLKRILIQSIDFTKTTNK